MKGTEKPGTNEKRKESNTKANPARIEGITAWFSFNMRKRSNLVPVEELIFVN
jgi:hypothetical protein